MLINIAKNNKSSSNHQETLSKNKINNINVQISKANI